MVSSHHVTARLYGVIFQFDLHNFIEVQHGFVCVADLEILIDHPCDLPSREDHQTEFHIFFAHVDLLSAILSFMFRR